MEDKRKGRDRSGRDGIGSTEMAGIEMDEGNTTMELMREVYGQVIEGSKLMEGVESAIMQKIKELTILQREGMTSEEYEEFRENLFEISAVAKEEAFIAGVQYGMTMLAENLIPQRASPISQPAADPPAEHGL